MDTPKKSNTGLIVIGIAVALLIICSLGDKEKNNTSTPQAKKQYSFAEMLASIDSGGRINPSDVAAFDGLLTSLDNKYSENKEQIGDMTVKAQSMLKDKNISESLLRIMRGVDSALIIEYAKANPSKYANLKYAEAIALYVMMRHKGSPHDEAVDGLRSLYRSLGLI